MKTIRILHLYHDLLNLYGDSGNIRILNKELIQQLDVEVIIDRKTIGDPFDFVDYDFVYVGAGVERNILVALEDLRPYVSQLKDFIFKNKVLLMTGGSFTILGKSITLPDGKGIEGLKLFDFETKLKKTRDNQDGVYQFIGGSQTDLAIGFINKSHEVTLDEDVKPLFEVIKGVGNSMTSNQHDFEGIRFKNFYASSLSGPILVKNPWFLEKLCVAILAPHGIDYISHISADQRMAYTIGLDGLMNTDKKKE